MMYASQKILSNTKEMQYLKDLCFKENNDNAKYLLSSYHCLLQPSVLLFPDVFHGFLPAAELTQTVFPVTQLQFKKN